MLLSFFFVMGLILSPKNNKIELMKTKFNPYGVKGHFSDMGSYYNLPYSYVNIVGVQPSVYEFFVPVAESSVEKLKSAGFERIFLCENEEYVNSELTTRANEICLKRDDVFVYMYRRDSIISRIEYMEEGDEIEEEEDKVFRCKIMYPNGADISNVLSLLERRPDLKKKGNVYLLCSMDGMLNLQRFEVRLPEGGVDLELNYGGEAAEKFEAIAEMLASDSSGLVLFSGEPGTGKSTFIKQLATRTTRKVIYLSSASADQITNPEFLSFIMSNRNCVLLLEDAEKALRSREEHDNPAVSNILNITDGILGDCLNVMVIATFNVDREMIDPALVRKGRLLLEHHFKALDADAANRVLENMGSDRRTSEPMTLAEIYNPEDNFHEDAEEKKRVGF